MRLSDADVAALDAVLRFGNSHQLRRLTNAGQNEFCDFLLEQGEFEWRDASHAAEMLDGISRKDLIRTYVTRATSKLKELDDLALVGGDQSVAGTVSFQLLDLRKTQFRIAWGPIRGFLREWDSLLGFTLIERPVRYHKLTDRVREFARPPRRRTRRPTEEWDLGPLPEADQTKEELFAQLTSTCTGLISRIALSYEANESLRRELIQDILLAIWVALPHFRGDTSLKTFAASIAQKRSITHVQKNVREPARQSFPAGVLAALPHAEDFALRTDQKVRLVEAIQTLPLPQRQAITLCYEGFSYGEMSEILGISTNAVMLRCQRAQTNLKAIMDRMPEKGVSNMYH